MSPGVVGLVQIRDIMAHAVPNLDDPSLVTIRASYPRGREENVWDCYSPEGEIWREISTLQGIG